MREVVDRRASWDGRVMDVDRLMLTRRLALPIARTGLNLDIATSVAAQSEELVSTTRQEGGFTASLRRSWRSSGIKEKDEEVDHEEEAILALPPIYHRQEDLCGIACDGSCCVVFILCRVERPRAGAQSEGFFLRLPGPCSALTTREQLFGTDRGDIFPFLGSYELLTVRSMAV